MKSTPRFCMSDVLRIAKYLYNQLRTELPGSVSLTLPMKKLISPRRFSYAASTRTSAPLFDTVGKFPKSRLISNACDPMICSSLSSLKKYFPASRGIQVKSSVERSCKCRSSENFLIIFIQRSARRWTLDSSDPLTLENEGFAANH